MTDKPLADVWASRDFPVLVEITRRLDAGGSVFLSAVVEALPLSDDEVDRAVRALQRRGLVTEVARTLGGDAIIDDVTGEAYLLTGLHPSPEAGADRLMAALEQAIDKAPEGERKTRLQKIRDGLLSAGRDLVVDVASGVITGQIPT
jgi:hypothetical protein